MRKICALTSQMLDEITEQVKEDVTTEELDQWCVDWCKKHKVTSACLDYKGYPKSVCTSVNHVVCHGIPGAKKLKNGDIINIDVAIISADGWYGDSSRMYYVGEPSVRAKRLTQVTYEAMMIGIEQIKPGKTTGDIGAAIQNYVEKNGFSIVKGYCGHGIGKVFHDAPSVPHYGKPGTGTVIEEGMIFTVEPMVNAGKATTKTLNDQWTVVTSDMNLSAQFEHTIGVTKDGHEIFTLSEKKFCYPPYV